VREDDELTPAHGPADPKNTYLLLASRGGNPRLGGRPRRDWCYDANWLHLPDPAVLPALLRRLAAQSADRGRSLYLTQDLEALGAREVFPSDPSTYPGPLYLCAVAGTDGQTVTQTAVTHLGAGDPLFARVLPPACAWFPADVAAGCAADLPRLVAELTAAFAVFTA
jgi:hypothetical protein